MKKADAPTTNIQSYIRVRPLAPKEKRATVLEFGKKEIHIKATAAETSKLSKTLMFDRVFDEDSKQIIVYNSVVKPMIKEVLQGYNCTVFAYGQTGTGKTYTMTGDEVDSKNSWDENVNAGIVPRAMQDLFTELANQPGEYQVSVCYMELYNEKLQNLIKDSSEETDIKLIDDLDGGVIMKGVLPTPVKSKEEAFKLLQEGAEKRQVAATQMNMNSSRSHTIFTINVNIKESIVAGKDDILRSGKLHLVDLAGSENVSKSGASEKIHKSLTGVNKRLAEASNINKSLLTLGRVITSLTENQSHIPYRESKLTRLLRDSLGGKTKTCIIGTISPAQANLDETESTLNYTSKARAIRNKPQKNQTISKKNFLQMASEEILKLKKDLEAVRQGEGFYISKESHEEMIARMKELDDQVKDWHQKYSRIKESFEETKELFDSLSSDFDDKCAEYEELEMIFRVESEKCKEKLSEFAKEIIVREYLIKEYEKTEGNLTEQAKTCKSLLENIVEQSNQLHDKIDRKQFNESENIEKLRSYKTNVSHKVTEFQTKLDSFLENEKNFAQDMTKFAGNMYEVIEEQSSEFTASMTSFEEKMKDIAQSVLENSLALQNKIVHEIKVSKGLKEEILQHSINHYREFIQTQMLVLMKNIQDKLEIVTEANKKGRDHFSMYKSQQAELVSKIMDNHESMQNLVQIIMTEVDNIKERHLKVSANAGSIQNHTDQASQGIKKMMNILMEAQLKIDSISHEAGSVVQDSAEVLQGVETLETTVRLDVTKYATEQSKIIEEVNQVSQQCTDDQKTYCCQIEDSIANLLAEQDSQRETIQSAVDQNIDRMEGLINKEKEYDSRLECTAEKISSYLSATKTTYGDEVRQFVGETKSKLEKKNLCLEVVFRKQLDETFTHLKQLERNQELGQAITELDENLKSINYAEYVPLGTTPQRVSKDNLEYPRKFYSTAPKAELIRRLRQKYPETESVPNENLDLKKHLPAGPFFNGEIPVPMDISPRSIKSNQTSEEGNGTSDLEFSQESSTYIIKRKSTSMPDLSHLLNDVFVAPSPIENKENIRTRSDRRTAKNKTSFLKKPKKVVLGSSQGTNSNDSTPRASPSPVWNLKNK